MQAESKLPQLKRSFFSSLDKKDLCVSVVFALLLAALAMLTCRLSEPGTFGMFPTFTTENYSFSWILLSLIKFPEDIVGSFFIIFTWIPMYTGFFGVAVVVFIASSVFKLIVFYSLALITKKILGRQDTFLYRHLPTLSICVISTCFLVLYIWPACRPQ
jgi:hypothetical protein